MHVIERIQIRVCIHLFFNVTLNYLRRKLIWKKTNGYIHTRIEIIDLETKDIVKIFDWLRF
jgi:hypothetical protein